MPQLTQGEADRLFGLLERMTQGLEELAEDLERRDPLRPLLTVVPDDDKGEEAR